MEQQLPIIAILFAASFLQGMTGFGSALVAVPLLTLFIDIKYAIPLSVLCSLSITLYLAIRLRSFLDRKKLIPLCLATVPGILVGVTFLIQVNSATIAVILGVMITAYGIYNLLIAPKRKMIHDGWVYIAGFLSGAIGSAFSAGGPPVIIYTTLKNWDKDTIKATLTGFFLFNSVLIVFAHAATGVTTFRVLISFFYSLPFVLIGTAVGSHCYSLLKNRSYLNTIYIVLICMGIMMITMNA